jgi:hypothetical protein
MGDAKTINNRRTSNPIKAFASTWKAEDRFLPAGLPTRVLMIFIVLTQSCEMGSIFGGIGDRLPLELRILEAGALAGENANQMRVVNIPNLQWAVLDALAIPEGVKYAQRSSIYGGRNYRTCALKEDDLLVVPLYAFRRGPYTCIRVYVENQTLRPIKLVTEACRLHMNGANPMSPSNESVDLTESTGVKAVVIGFDCELENYRIVDNGDGPRTLFAGLPLSGYGAQANANLGCEPYNSFKPIEVLRDSPTLEIPSGRHAIVTFCYLPESDKTGAFDFVVRTGSAEKLLGFRVVVGR